MSIPPGPAATDSASQPTGSSPARLPRLLHLATVVLGVVILLLGFATAQSAPQAVGALGAGATDFDFYGSGFGWIPALFFIGGLLAVPEVLPAAARERVGILPAAVTAGAWIAALCSAVMATASVGFGMVLVLLLGFVQAGAAVTNQLAVLGYVTLPDLPRRGGAQDRPGPPNPGVRPVPGAPPGPQPPAGQSGFAGGSPPPGGWNPNSAPQPAQPAQPPQPAPQRPFGQQPAAPGQQPAAPGQQPGQRPSAPYGQQGPAPSAPFGQPGGWSYPSGEQSSDNPGGRQGTRQMPHPGDQH